MSDLSPAAQHHASQALLARQRGDAAAERTALEAALAHAPDHPQLLNAAGMRAMADGDLDAALARFAAAAAADAAQPILWVNQATVHRMLGDEAGERAALDQALSLDRTHLTALLRSAEWYQRHGAASEAAQAWAGIVQMASAMAERPPAIDDALARGRAFLAEHNAALGRDIAAALPDAPSRRMAACIDHMLGRRAIYVNQCAGVHFPFLPAEEFFDPAHFPWFDALAAKTDAIRAEALALMESGDAAIRPYVRQEAGTPDNKWSPLDGSTDWSACFLWEYGIRNEAVCARCPETAAALASIPQTNIPGKAPTAFFSILKAHAHIPAHTGVTNTRAIVHLPLVVPERCRFRVGGETRSWREGEPFAFDDTIEHEAWNDSDQPRVVLIFDVWNPHLTPDEQAQLQTVFAVTGGGSVQP